MGDDVRIFGKVTIRGVRNPEVLDGHFNGMQKAARGDRIWFDATTTINRLDYGLK